MFLLNFSVELSFVYKRFIAIIGKNQWLACYSILHIKLLVGSIIFVKKMTRFYILYVLRMNGNFESSEQLFNDHSSFVHL